VTARVVVVDDAAQACPVFPRRKITKHEGKKDDKQSFQRFTEGLSSFAILWLHFLQDA
jgi:hypothetical protein